MRSGKRRGLTVAIPLGMALMMGLASGVRADGIFHHTIPRETLALDYRTGDVMMAPPIPYGHYAKDVRGSIHGAAAKHLGMIHGLAGKLHGGGHGLGHGGGCASCGDGAGYGDPSGGCADGNCGGLGLGHGGAFGGLFHKKGHNFGGHGLPCLNGDCGPHGSPQVPTKVAAAPVKAAPQAVASAQVDPVCGGCLGTGLLAKGGGCGLCGGTGHLKGLLGHGHGGFGGGNACGNCGGRGCGACGGKGLFGHGGGNGCGACGGRGCGLCGGLGGLKGKAHGIVAKVLHKGEIQYFVGAGGPVPLTPGYVPYIVTTRSPRDYFAFPPFSDQIP